MKNHSQPITIDCEYIYPRFAASYLLVENKKATFIETNTSHSVPILLNALRGVNLKPADVEYIVITHAHLDHAGGASALMKACPQATLLAHPKAVRHMIDPEKLITGAEAVYGKEKFQQLYGEISPIPAARVKPMEDAQELNWGSRTFRFIHTLGHANHHFCILDSKSRGIFTGDSFGLAYPDLQKNGLFVFPSTSPTGYEPEAAIQSIEKILKSGARSAYLTHFGEVTQMDEVASQISLHLELSWRLFDQLVTIHESYENLEKLCLNQLTNHYKKILEQKGMGSDKKVCELMKLDLELNAAGIAYSANRQKEKTS